MRRADSSAASVEEKETTMSKEKVVIEDYATTDGEVTLTVLHPLSCAGVPHVMTAERISQ